jgi:prolyl-tRNA editing enzyme YbaK/EbsC (Cys-tRNA(Pro) deacylase)
VNRKIRGEIQVREALLASGCEPVIKRSGQGTETAHSSSRELGVGLERIVKSLVFSADEEPIVVLLAGDRRADAKRVAAVLGAEKVRLADPEMVLEWTGFPVGAVPPLGHRQRIPVLMDEGIPAEGFIFPAAGETNNAFQTTFRELKAVTNAKVCAISREGQSGI